MRSSVAPYRVFTLKEIEAIPDGTTTDELFEVFGPGIEGRSEVTPFIILAREGHAKSEEDRTKYGFYVWPSSIVKEYTDRIKIEYISHDPKGDGQQIIIWPSSMRGLPIPKGIPALKSKTTEPNQALEPTTLSVTSCAPSRTGRAS